MSDCSRIHFQELQDVYFSVLVSASRATGCILQCISISRINSQYQYQPCILQCISSVRHSVPVESRSSINYALYVSVLSASYSLEKNSGSGGGVQTSEDRERTCTDMHKELCTVALDWQQPMRNPSNRERCTGEVPKRQEQINKRESQTQYLTRFDNLPTSSGQGREILLIQVINYRLQFMRALPLNL